MMDMAHTSGLVATGQVASPFEVCIRRHLQVKLPFSVSAPRAGMRYRNDHNTQEPARPTLWNDLLPPR